jgi:DNA-binding MarR family transcriptional regulator
MSADSFTVIKDKLKRITYGDATPGEAYAIAREALQSDEPDAAAHVVAAFQMVAFSILVGRALDDLRFHIEPNPNYDDQVSGRVTQTGSLSVLKIEPEYLHIDDSGRYENIAGWQSTLSSVAAYMRHMKNELAATKIDLLKNLVGQYIEVAQSCSLEVIFGESRVMPKILKALYECGDGQNRAMLTEKIGIKNNAMLSGLLQKLVFAGLVNRSPEKEEKEMITLTPYGRSMCRKHFTPNAEEPSVPLAAPRGANGALGKPVV